MENAVQSNRRSNVKWKSNLSEGKQIAFSIKSKCNQSIRK